MAKGIREIKSRIKSVQSTKQITKAMEMVAASKLKRAQDSAQASRPYAEKIKEVIENVAASTTDSSHPMLVSRPLKRTGYILITSDRGQAGGYNANVFRLLMETIKEKHASPDEYAIFVLGKKGRDNLKKRDIPVLEEIVDLNDTPTFSEIRLLTNKAVKYYADGQYDELYLVYNQFVSALQQVPVVNRLLPLAEMTGDKAGNSSQYEYEPSAEAVLDVLLPKYAETLIYNALLEAKASEFGARMTAMGNATKNATEMISGLTLVYNRARQAAITQEITEIVAGASAQS